MSIRGLFLLLAASCAVLTASASVVHCEAAWGEEVRGEVRGEEVLVAVATNFNSVAQQLEREFEASRNFELTLVSGSTGKLYAQIVNGAPFHVLLAADQRRPARLVAEGLAMADTLRTYAIGRLVLWSHDPEGVAFDGRKTLREARFRRLAIANPDLAPYGVASIEVLKALEVDELISDRLVMGENIGQTYALIATGNAELGFVAASQQAGPDAIRSGSGWLVPEELHEPIRQDVVLLRSGVESSGARAFLDYLASPPAKDLIRSFGYGVD